MIASDDVTIGDPALAQLVAVLRHQLEIVEDLRYRHHAVLLLLGAGAVEHLSGAVDDLAVDEDRFGEADGVRAAVVQLIAERWDLPADARLPDLIGRADPPTAELLAELGGALRAAMDELAEVRALASTLAEASLDVVSERTDRVVAGGVDPVGRHAGATSVQIG